MPDAMRQLELIKKGGAYLADHLAHNPYDMPGQKGVHTET